MDAMSGSRCVNDHTLGPTVQGCRGDFDFTLKFEHVVLSIVPSSVFIALALPRVVYLVFRASRVVGAASFQYLKLVSGHEAPCGAGSFSNIKPCRPQCDFIAADLV